MCVCDNCNKIFCIRKSRFECLVLKCLFQPFFIMFVCNITYYIRDIKGLKFVCVGVVSLAFNALLHTTFEQKEINNQFCI